MTRPGEDRTWRVEQGRTTVKQLGGTYVIPMAVRMRVQQARQAAGACPRSGEEPAYVAATTQTEMQTFDDVVAPIRYLNGLKEKGLLLERQQCAETLPKTTIGQGCARSSRAALARNSSPWPKIPPSPTRSQVPTLWSQLIPT